MKFCCAVTAFVWHFVWPTGAEFYADVCAEPSEYIAGKVSLDGYTCDQNFDRFTNQEYYPATRRCDAESSSWQNMFTERFLVFDCCGSSGSRCYPELHDFSGVCQETAEYTPSLKLPANSIDGSAWRSPDWAYPLSCDRAFRLLATEALVAGYGAFSPSTMRCDELLSVPSWFRNALGYLAFACCGSSIPRCVQSEDFSGVCADPRKYKPSNIAPALPEHGRQGGMLCSDAMLMHVMQARLADERYDPVTRVCNTTETIGAKILFGEYNVAFACCSDRRPRCMRNFSQICLTGAYGGNVAIRADLTLQTISMRANSTCDSWLTVMDLLNPNPMGWDCSTLSPLEENAYAKVNEHICCGTSGQTRCSKAGVTTTLAPDSSGGEIKRPETWSDMQAHLAIAGGFWIALSLIGVTMSSCRSSWDTERVEKTTRLWVNTFTGEKYYLIPMGAVACMMCLVAVLRGYGADYPGWMDEVELYAAYLHMLEILTITLHCAARSTEEIVSFSVGRLHVDSMVCLSAIAVRHVNVGHKFSFGYVAAFRLEMLWNSYSLTRRRCLHDGLYAAIMKLFAITFSISCLLRQAETLDGPQWHVTLDNKPAELSGPSAPASNRWTMTTSAYFVMSCVTTVGFGDFYPKSLLGQLSMVVITFLGLFMFTKNVFGIAQNLETGRRGGGNYQNKKRAKHVVICGGFDLNMITNFLAELYHEDHGVECEDLNSVIMLLPGQSHVRAGLKEHMKVNRELLHRIWLIEGSALKPHDLDRVSYQHAATAFILPDLYAIDPEREDLENVMRALSMTGHTQYVRVVPMLLQAEHTPLMLAAGVVQKDIVCLDELKLGLLGKSCVTQGFITLAATLVKNMSVENSAKTGLADEPWVEHYLHGIANELYEEKLSPAYFGAPFINVALDILARSEGTCYLVGLVEDPLYPHDQTITRLFPGRYFRVGTATDRLTKGVFIAQDKQDIKQHDPGQRFQWSFAKLMDGAEVASAVQTAAQKNSLPNAVPMDDEDAGAACTRKLVNLDGSVQFFHTPGEYGWIRDPWHVEDEHEERVVKSMQEIATRRAVTTLSADGVGSSETELEKMIGRKVTRVKADSLDAEDAEGRVAESGDEVERALARQNKQVMKEVEQEAAKRAEKKRLKDEQKLKTIAKRVVRIAEERYEDQLSLEGDTMSGRDREDDDALWGGPPPPPPPIWGNPKEPPTALLQRGGHVVVVALDAKGPGSRGPIAGKLGLHLLAKSLRATNPLIPTPVVVVASRPPLDWPKITHAGHVYLLVCNPISAMNLRRASLRTASAVVVHQDSRVAGSDLSTVDAEAIFACKVVDSVLTEANRDVPVLVDINLQQSAVFLPTNAHERKNHIQIMEQEMKEMEALREMDEDDKIRQAKEEIPKVPFHMENRFIIGQLFSSTLLISMCANMLYNPALGAVVREMVHAKVAALPVPDEFKGYAFRQLYEYMMKRKNMLVVALLRRQDESVDALVFEDDPDDEEEKADKKPERFVPGEPAWRRYVLTMPEGNRAVAEHDGLLCIMPPDEAKDNILG